MPTADPHPEAIGSELFGGRANRARSWLSCEWADSPNCGTANPSTTVSVVRGAVSFARIRGGETSPRCSPGTTSMVSMSAEIISPTAPPLSDDELDLINAYWRAANYLSVGQIYLLDNPLLREKLAAEHVKPRLLGHWGTTGPQPDLCASESDHPHATPMSFTSPGPVTAARGAWPTPTSKAPTARCTPVSPRIPRGCESCSVSSHFPAVSPATSRRKRRVDPRGR